MNELSRVDKRWTYCPECGSTEIRHAEGDHKQCACCLQEWFADIDYTDVVRTNLGNRMQLRSSLTAAEKHRITVGAFVLTPCEDPRFIGIAHESGEAGTFKTDNLEQALFKFFREQF